MHLDKKILEVLTQSVGFCATVDTLMSISPSAGFGVSISLTSAVSGFLATKALIVAGDIGRMYVLVQWAERIGYYRYITGQRYKNLESCWPRVHFVSGASGIICTISISTQ